MENKDLLKQLNVSGAVVRRLPRYYRYLGELKKEGVERISSGKLSKTMEVTASQIRQDLNNFGGFGQQGYGYNVNYLFNEIGKILGVDKLNNMIIIGAGHMGQALSGYGFIPYGVDITAMFDIDPNLIGKTINGVLVQDYKNVAQFIKENKVDIAVLTVPRDTAEDIAKELVDLGVHAFWNFAYTDLRLGDHVIVENVHLSDSLLSLSYSVNNKVGIND